MFIILIIILAVCLSILIKNIELERAQEAFAIVIAAAVAVTIFVVLKSEKTEITFPYNVFFDKETSSPLFIRDIYTYNRKNLNAELVWGNFTKRENWKGELKKFGDGTTQQIAIGQNLFEAVFLERLLSLYRFHWNIKIHNWNTALGYSGQWGPENGEKVKQADVKIYSKEDLQAIFKDNIFVKDIGIYNNKLVLPKGTKLTVKRDTKNWTTLVQFQHRNFDVSIDFSGSRHWMVGLGSLGELLKITPEEAQKKYAGLEVVIILKAKFRSGPFGFSKTKEYKKWIETMFAILRNEFDGELLWKEIKEELLLKHIAGTDKN